ncbi:uncharacterized protein LOC133670579 isoform X2 [Populus nigra]|uniref:uncharacterized protein LOC133670579 isoform X2 n=1 Tax=Populus nigra TaxID=3691 RepID=UPI002B27808D|nr:uncharacterized protein LOC133670579 isoform X2 [Populus nigra]
MMGFVFLLRFAVKCLGVLAWPVFGLGYPLCASIQAIETNSNSDTQKLISYWVSITVVLLLEHSFQLEWLAFWPYIKLMIVGYLVLPYFDGSLYVYKHLINPCLSMSSAIITCQFNKQELFFKKDYFLVEMRRYMKENGSDALEDLIASTKKSAKPDVDVKEIRAVEAENLLKFDQLPVRFKDSNDVETTEKIEVASTKQARQAESNVNQTENRTFPPLECINTATTTVGGGHLCGILPPEKVRKVWTCVICQVTAQSETALISHLHGKRHKATREQLNVKNQTDVNSHLQGKSRCIEMIGSHWFCTICNVSSVHGKQSHLKGKKHRASLQALDGLGGNRHA